MGRRRLAPIAVNAPSSDPLQPPDTLFGQDLKKWRDSAIAVRIEARKQLNDSLHKASCDSTGHRVVARMRAGVAVAVDVSVRRCVARALDGLRHAALRSERAAVRRRRSVTRCISQSLPFGAQALLRFSELPKPNIQYGLSLTRYNRIEGFSTGVGVEQQLGAGYVASGVGRFGFADREPNVELSLARTNLDRSVTFTGYNRLVSANDWGNPLSFGPSVSAFLFGRDDGFYYRASGADLSWTTRKFASLDWRLFGEQERTAVPRTDFSLGPSFEPNIVAATGAFYGGGVRWQTLRGDDPRGLRFLSDFRAEAATGDSTYGRTALDLTVRAGLPLTMAAGLTVAGGTSVGQLPAQRRWFLGGTPTVRGQVPDTAQSGNAFWLTRLELGPDRGGYRIMLFGDLGWTGNRSAIGHTGRPLSGVGIAYEVLDGFLHVDLARGIYPREQFRTTASVQARF